MQGNWREIRLRKLAVSCALALVVSMVFVVVPSQVSAGPCQPAHITVTMEIYGGFGQILLAGIPYSNGAQLGLLGGCSNRYHISASIPPYSGWTFFEWETSAGGVVPATSMDSTYSTGFFSGALILVLGKAQTDSNPWGGFVASGSGFTKASGTFTLPSSATFVSIGGKPNNLAAFWVGIGGVNGNRYLWQAGVELQKDSSNHTTMYLWYEAWPSLSVFVPTPGNGVIAFHDRITITVWYGYPHTGDDSFRIEDATQGWTTGVVTPMNGFVPDRTVVEWIIESPNYQQYPFPRMAGTEIDIYGARDAPATNGWALPLSRWIAADGWFHYVTPGYLSAGYLQTYVSSIASYS